MTDKAVSALTSLTGANTATGDLLYIVDISEASAADRSKKITIQELFDSVPAGAEATPAIATQGDQNTGIWFPAADTIAISTGGVERLRVNSNGEFLVGATSTASNSDSGFKVLSPVSGHYDPAVVTDSNASSASCWDIYSTAAAAYRFYVTTTGVINATNTTISAISDVRLKENIQDLDVGLDKIMALKPRKFDWKEGKGKNIKGDRGWIAQEFEQVFPEMIDKWKDPAPENEEPYKSVRADLIPVLVKAIQQQQAMIQTLEAKVTALEAR
jgi:hypothetical protein